MSKHKSKDKQKKGLNIYDRRSITAFRGLCRKCLGVNPGNRFICMSLLAEAIQQKRGAYTEESRTDWLSILYACLAAPDGYFLENPARLEEKRIRKYRRKHESLLRMWKQERTNERAMYTYIDCVRAYWAKAKTRGVQRTKNNPYARNLWESVYRGLEKRIEKNPRLQEYDCKYQETLKRIFNENQHYLNNPVFFLFLPYYVFFELAKCEGLIREKDDAFSIIQLGKEQISWSIRNAPIKPSSAEIHFNQVCSLYDLVEEALCQSLQEQNYQSIGRHMWTTNCECRQQLFSAGNETEDAINRAVIADAIDFSVPFWKYEIWASHFAYEFKGDEEEEKEKKELSKDALAMDIHKLLSFAFRPAGQAQMEREKILEKYKGYETYLRKHIFKLSELLDALCTVYNLRFFDSEKPFNQELQNAVEQLTGFLIACDRLPLSAIDAPTSAQWLTLIKSGYYYYDAFEIRSSDYDDNIDRYLKNPNRILFCAVLMQLNMLFERVPKRYLLTDTGAYSLKKLSNSLYTALCSKQAILRDLLIWGGINVCLDRDHVNSMREAFHVWSVWHRNESLKYQGLMKYLGLV